MWGLQYYSYCITYKKIPVPTQMCNCAYDMENCNVLAEASQLQIREAAVVWSSFVS